jgi:hypothetical protein
LPITGNKGKGKQVEAGKSGLRGRPPDTWLELQELQNLLFAHSVCELLHSDPACFLLGGMEKKKKTLATRALAPLYQATQPK